MKLRNKTTGEEFCEVKQEFHSQYEANNEKWDMLSCSKEPVTPPPTTPPPPITPMTPHTPTTRWTTTERVPTTTRDEPTTTTTTEETTSEGTTTEETTPQATTSIVSTTTCRNVCNTVERCWTESKTYKEWGCDKACTWIFCHQINCRLKTRCCRQEQVCGPTQECRTVCG